METPVVPETPEDTSRLPEELENVVVQEITAAQPGQTVTVDMQSASVVTKEMLGAAKGKDVNIQLNLGGYSWTINGKDILASDLSDIDLEVKQNTGAIPSRVIQSMAGDNPVQQLSLTHNGDFGFRASLTINVGSENSGKYGNLYYYDSTGKMVFMNAGVIDANGNVTLSFSHASEYLIVVNDRVMSNDDVPADLRPGTDTSDHSGEYGKYLRRQYLSDKNRQRCGKYHRRNTDGMGRRIPAGCAGAGRSRCVPEEKKSIREFSR